MNAITPIKLDCATCPARPIAACGSCTDVGSEILHEISHRKHHRAHSTIIFAGDNPSHLMTIIHGVVATMALLNDGRTQILSLHFKGDIIGRTVSSPYQHELVAMTDVELCHKPREDFTRVVSEDPGFREAFIEFSQLTLDQSRTWMVALGKKTARERVATFLSFLVSRGVAGRVVPGKNLHLCLPLTRIEIGDFLGMSVETVSRQFSALRKASLIDGKGRDIIILDLPGLIYEACEDDAGVLA